MRLFAPLLSIGLILGGLLHPATVHAQGLLTSEPQLAIPDDGGGPACVDTVTFTQPGEAIGAFRVGLAIRHDHQSQLRVLLLPPGVGWPSATYAATEIPTAVAAGAIELVANAGGSNMDIGYGWTQPYTYTDFTTSGDPVFDASSLAMSIDTAADATGLPGTWLAHDASALAAVYGGDPADLGGQGGTWTLVVIDDAPTADGTLVAWQLEYDVLAAVPPEILLLRDGVLSDGGTDDLGTWTTGVPQSVVYSIGNTGLGVLHLSAVSTAAATNCTVTVVTPVPLTVEPLDASPLELEVTPLADGPFAFDLQLDNDDADENPYHLHVTGTAQPQDATPTPELVVTGQTSFRVEDVGYFETSTWTVSNAGDGDLVITSVDSIGVHASSFGLGGLSVPVTLAPGHSATLQVTYLPDTVRSHAATIRFFSNHGGVDGTATQVGVTGFVTGTVEDPGCQCRSEGGPGSGAILVLLLVLGVLAWRRRGRSA